MPSLVGSEMCIRDRLSKACINQCKLCSDGVNCTQCYETNAYYLYQTDYSNILFTCLTCNLTQGQFIYNSQYKQCRCNYSFQLFFVRNNNNNKKQNKLTIFILLLKKKSMYRTLQDLL
eukprot:TRINITY_DN9055_c0_g1_i1.p4 TRINITY_DN9055_c0_g1~~TRINITY_DN9055_c0_g1_i1.p4  ORF type:complete len:118 (+),score=17.16 TRINITY_DN9055_c0_g1_i1:120-473(+)